MNDESKLIEEFDTFADCYDEVITEHLGYCAHTIIPTMMSQYITNKTPEILDLGCGTGISSSLFFEKGYNVAGIDLSFGMIEQARLRPFKRLYCQSLELPLHLKENEFDAVVMLGVLEFINNTAQLLSRIYTVLKPDGVLGVTFPMNIPTIDTELIVKAYSEQEIQTLIKNAGFTILKSESFLGYDSSEYTIDYTGYVLAKA